MKTGMLLIVFVSILLIAYSKVEMQVEKDAYVPKKALIIMEGNSLDTAYLHSTYKDAGAMINEWDRIPNCAYRYTHATGAVNSEVLGTYYIKYEGEDASGNILAEITRTVHVVENSAGFLNGIYNVTCTCSAISDTLRTTTSYIAAVSSGSTNHVFNLSKLEMGAGFTRPLSLMLKGNVIKQLIINSCDFDPRGSVIGKLSSSKNSFTIESSGYTVGPLGKFSAKFNCINVFKNSAGS